MAGNLDPGELQSRFQASLVGLGYTGSVCQLPANLGQDVKLFNFVKTVTERLNPEHFLSSQDITKFKELKSTGAVLEGESLQHALSQLGLGDSTDRGRRSAEAAAQEVEEMKLKIASAKSQLSTLTAVKSKLSEHYASLAHERDDLDSQKSVCQRHLQEAMEAADQDNLHVNAAAQELESCVKSVCLFHHGEGKTKPRFLSQVSQVAYHASENRYLSELTAYTKKQFFEGIAAMAAPHSVEDSQCDVDLGDQEQVLLRGLTQDQHQAHCQELNRLQTVYPITEMTYLNARISEQYAVSATSRAEEELSTLKQPDWQQPEPTNLRNLVTARQTHISDIKSKITEINCNVLPALLLDMACLKVSGVLHGDHDLKLARQDYFTSKQRKVIACLQSQRARHEQLSMLYEVELRRHRETHRLLSTTKGQLVNWKSNREKRIHALKSTTHVAVTSPRQTVDSGDLFTQRVCALLDVHPSPDSPFITIESLRTAMKQLVHRLSTVMSVVQARSLEQADIVDEQERLMAKYSSIFPEGGRPQLTIKEYRQENDQLTSLVATMEKNIKALLKQFDGHRKTISTHTSLATERLLFVHFFTNSSRLLSMIGEMNRRIDAIAASLNH